MPRLLFDGNTHQLSLIDNDSNVIGVWAAYNNVDSHATITHVQNRTYNIQDGVMPHRHTPNANGPYGLHGIIRFDVPNHPGIGVHSGRANARHLPGAMHPTMGCMRTTDEAMLTISNVMRVSPLTTIEVINNSAPVALHASNRHRHTNLHGRHAR